MATPVPITDDSGTDGGTYPPASSGTPPATTTTAPPAPPASSGSTPSSTTPAPAATVTLPASSALVSSILQAVATPVDTVTIPLSAVPSQTLAVALGNQNCTINLYTRSTGLYLDLAVSDVPICTGILCLDRNIIVRASYLGFQGELTFIDTQGTSDPTYDGLGGRYNLVWLDF